MKFSSATLVSVLAATAATQVIETPKVVKVAVPEVAAPVAAPQVVAPKVDVDAVIASLESLQRALNLNLELQVRALVGEFIGKRDAINLNELIDKLVKFLPNLFSNLWNSAIFHNLITTLWNLDWLKRALNNAINWVINLINSSLNGPAKRSVLDPFIKRQLAGHMKRTEELADRLQNDPSLTAREFALSFSGIITAILNSGIFKTVLNAGVSWLKTNPQIFLTIINALL